MAFRSLVLVSLVLVGGAMIPPVPTHAQARADAMAAVNAALAKKDFVIIDGTPTLR